MARWALALLLLPSLWAQAECECLWQGSFSEIAADADLIVSATTLEGKGNSLDFSVQRTLAGPEPHSPIRVWMKTGDYCRPEASEFPGGSQWVLALHKIEEDVPGGFNPNTPNVSYGRIGDYQLSSCGGYWLSQEEGWVTGNLIEAPRWERDPKMTPVLLDLVADYVAGKLEADALLAASKEDPALRELMLDTRSFLRHGELD